MARYFNIPSTPKQPKVFPVKLSPSEEKLVAGTRKVLVAVITQSDEVKVATMLALMNGLIDAVSAGVLFTIETFKQKPQAHARNIACSKCLAENFDDVFFIDDDVAWEPGAMVKLLRYPVDVVAGVYPYRGGEVNFPISWLPQRVETDPATGLLEIMGTGAGFLLVRRRALEQMRELLPDHWYGCGEAPEGKCPDFFMFEVEDHVLTSEDMTFFKRYRSIGGRVWIDPEIKFQHIGDTVFHGCVADWLEKRMQAVGLSAGVSADAEAAAA